MKLATIKNNTRDGQLIIVNRDLTKAVKVPEIAQTMQEALDNWDIISLKLEKVYNALQNNTMPNTFNFDSSQAMAAIPRAYHWADGSAYVTHVELVRKSSKCRITKDILDRPSNVHGASDAFIGANEDIKIQKEEWGIDFESEVAVITDDTPAGVSAKNARK